MGSDNHGGFCQTCTTCNGHTCPGCGRVDTYGDGRIRPPMYSGCCCPVTDCDSPEPRLAVPRLDLYEESALMGLVILAGAFAAWCWVALIF